MVTQRRERILGPSSKQRSSNVRSVRIARETARKREEQKKELASQLDKDFLNPTNKFATVKESQDFYSQLPPEIKSLMKTNPATVQKSNQKTISSLKKRIEQTKKNLERTREREREARSDSARDRYRAREDRDRAEIRALEEGIKELEKGNILSERQVISFANDKGRAEELRTRAKLQERKAKADVLEQVKKGAGNVTQISYDRQGNISSIVVDGNRVSTSGLPKIQRNEIELTAVRKANQKTRQKTFEKLADENLTIGELRDKGLSMQEINQVGQIRLADELTKKQAEGKKLNDNELKILGFNERQIKAINSATDGRVTNRELLDAGLNWREIAQVGQQLQTNKIVDKIKNQKEDIVLSKVLDRDVTKRLQNLGLNQSEVKKTEEFMFDNVKENLGTKLSNDWLQTSIRANKGNKKAKAALFWGGSVAAALAQGVFDIGKAGVSALSFVTTPKFVYNNDTNTWTTQQAEYVKSLNKPELNQITRDLRESQDLYLKGLQRGDPGAVAATLIALAPVRLPKNIPGFSSSLVKQNVKGVAVSNTNFKVRQNLLKGSGKFEIETTGLTQQNVPFSIKGSLSSQPKTKTLQGKLRITEGKNKRTVNVVLKDEGAFFVDKKNNIKIPKLNKKLDGVQVKVVQQKDTIKNKKLIINRVAEGEITTGKRAKERLKVIATPTTKTEITTKEGVKFEKFIGSKKGKPFKDFLETSSKAKSIKSLTRKPPKSRTTGDWDKLIRFLEFIDYDKKIIAGFDKRTWMARMLGLNKNEVNSVIKRFDKDFKEGYILKQGKLTASGKYETINPQAFRLGPSFAFSKPKVLNKLKTTNNRVNVPQTIKIPDLAPLLTMPRKLKPGVKIPKTYLRIAARIGFARFYDFEKTSLKQRNDIVKAFDKLRDQKGIKERAKIPARVKIPSRIKTPTRVKTPSKIKTPSRIKTPVRVPFIPRIKPPKAPPLKIKIPSTEKKPREFIKQPLGKLGFVVRDPTTKQRRTITVNTGLPFTEAKRIGRDLVDSALLASFQVKPYGKNKKRLSLKKINLKKFRSKKGKDPKVRELVEKKKFRLDRKGETKAISQARIKKLVTDESSKVKNLLSKLEKKKLQGKSTNKPKKSLKTSQKALKKQTKKQNKSKNSNNKRKSTKKNIKVKRSSSSKRKKK